MTFTCYRRVGSNDATTQSCYWVIEEYVNGAWVSIEAGGSAATTKTRYVGTNATSVRATAYLDSTMSSSSRLDSQDIPVISNGADGYTVVLSNESHTFGGGVSAAVSGSAQSNIIAYKGTTRVSATIGTITGQPTGMTTSISNNGTTSARFTVDVTTAMTTRSGTLNVPVTVDGKSFTLVFSYAVAFKGETGDAGINTATVYLYRLLTSTTTPAGPVNSTTYRFSTKTLSGTPGNSWSTTLPSGNGTLWMAVATASSNVDTDTIEANEWVVTKLARDGTNGTNGADGYNKATITLYRRYASTPSKPSTQTVYTFSTGSLDTIPSGWSLSIPAVDANHNPCYATSVSAVSQADTYTISSSAWTSPVKIVEDGEDGVGLTATTSLRYVTSLTTVPAKPPENVKVVETRPVTATWTLALPALNNVYKYIYTCDMLEWDNGTITFTDVVLNNSLSDLVTRVAAAELKIQDDAIVAAVRNSESYKADLSSKNATYSGAGTPTTSNYPASSWTTDALKQMHENDTFLTNSGSLYQYVQGSFGLKIRFSEDSETEQRYDFVRLYYQREGKTYVLPDISGTAISGATVFVPSNIFWLYWKSDSSVNKYGFRILSIEWAFNSWPDISESTLPSITPIDTSGDTYPETNHPYSSNEEKMWKYTTSNATTPTITYNWVLREDPKIRTLGERVSSAELKITDSAIVSTVRSSTSYLNDLNGKANTSDLDGLITADDAETIAESVIEQTADAIRLKADRIAWTATNSSMTENGTLTCQNVNISGTFQNTGTETYDAWSGSYIYRKTVDVLHKMTGLNHEFYADNVICGRIMAKYVNLSGGSMNFIGQISDTEKPLNIWGGTHLYLGVYYNEDQSAVASAGSHIRLYTAKTASYGSNYKRFTHFNSNIAMNAGTGIYFNTSTASSEATYLMFGQFGNDPYAVQVLPALYVGSKKVAVSSSSRRYKHDIEPLKDASLDPHKLYDLVPKQFVFNDSTEIQYNDMKGKTLPGFIAEEVDEIYPAATIHDGFGRIENWDERRIIPGMLVLIKEQNERIKALEAMMS